MAVLMLSISTCCKNIILSFTNFIGEGRVKPLQKNYTCTTDVVFPAESQVDQYLLIPIIFLVTPRGVGKNTGKTPSKFTTTLFVSAQQAFLVLQNQIRK